MADWASEAASALEQAFDAARDEARARAMSDYMRAQFPFVGIPTPDRRRITKAALKELGRPNADDVLAAANALWSLPEREYQYAAVDLLAQHANRLPATALPDVRELIRTKSWWDTVDALAAQVVGPMVTAHPQLTTAMDDWAASPELWLARAAILHQLKYREQTDEERLFRYCLSHARDSDFFMRKGIGWALREYSKTAPDAVRSFVHEHWDVLSPLARKEALRLVGGEQP